MTSSNNSASVNTNNNQEIMFNTTDKQDFADMTDAHKPVAKLGVTAEMMNNMVVDKLPLAVYQDWAAMVIPNFEAPGDDYYEIIQARQEALAKLWFNTGFQPVPLAEKLILVVHPRKQSTINAQLIAMIDMMRKYNLGTEFIAAMDQKGLIVSLEDGELIAVTPNDDYIIPQTAFNNDVHANVPCLLQADFANFVFRFIDGQMAKLSLEQRVQMLTLIRSKVKPCTVNVFRAEVDDYNSKSVAFDFFTGEIQGRKTDAYKLISKISVGASEYSTASTMLILAGALSSADKPNEVLSNLPNLFERETTYGEMDNNDPTKVIMENSILPISFIADPSGYPYIQPINAKFDRAIVPAMLAEGKALMVDKYAMQFVANETAANAALIGRDGDNILSLHDAAKAAKAFNRPTQARKHTKAGLVGKRSNSSFSSVLPDGREVVQGGLKLRTILTNSRLTAGSGPAYLNLMTQLTASVYKTKSFKLNWDRLPKDFRNIMVDEADCASTNPHERARKGMAYLQAQIADRLDDIAQSGKVFEPGETIYACGINKEIVLLKNDSLNQPMRLVRVKKQISIVREDKKANYYSDYFQMSVAMELKVTDQWFKLRNDGLKLTTLPYNVAVSGLTDWDIMLNIETMKGKLCQVILFTEANGGGKYYANRGVLVMNNDGREINLRDTVNEVTGWVDANVETRTIEMKVARAEWVKLQQYGSTADITVVEDTHKDYVVLSETVEALVGYQHYEIEVSTPRENTGTCAMTPEMLAALSLQNRKLAQHIYDESVETRAMVINLVDMISSSNETAPQVIISDSIGRKEVANAVGNLDGKTDRSIISAFKKAYPQGVTFVTKTENAAGDATRKLYLNFGVITGMGFVGKDTQAIADDVVSFLNYIVNPDESGVDNKVAAKVNHLRTSLKGWLIEASGAQGVMKKLARTAKVLVTGKVRTTYHSFLNHEEGELPKLALNPTCDMVKELGIKDGEIIGFNRIPMVMMGAAQVIFNEEVGVGHVALLPHIWAMCNEGDSDGDGIGVINFTSRGVTKEEALAMNAHLMGLAGYTLAYGNNPSGWPCAEFSSYDDKHGKKALTSHKDAYVTAIPVEKYDTDSALVSDHYRGKVGIAYGLCSALTFVTVQLNYLNHASAPLHTEALAVAWRLVYEGLGLGGYSPKAIDFFAILSILARMQGKSHFVKKDANNAIVGLDKNEPQENGFDGLTEMVKLLSIGHLPNARKIVKLLVNHEEIRANRTVIERGQPKSTWMANEDKLRCAIYAGLRSSGQGLDTGAEGELLAREEAAQGQADEDGPVAASLFTIVKKNQLWKSVACPWLAETLQNAAETFTKVSKIQFNAKQAEEGEG